MHANGKLYRVDGRSREGRLLRDTRDALLEQLNRKPTPAEKLLIDRLAWLHLCTQLIDARILAGNIDYGEAIQYSSQINAFSHGLSNLGLLGSSIQTQDAAPSAPTPESAKRSQTHSAGAQTREAVGFDD